jgi:endo-1,4-beta-D-glucanase Y
LRLPRRRGRLKARPPRLGVLALALAVLLGAACQAAPPGDLDRVLKGTWQSYRQSFISPAGRVVIPEQDRSTISEAQAYALLRAVWAGDEAVFVRVRAWTRQHLSRAQGPGDHLLSWSWGRRPDGSSGVKDANTAADADVDYALALILAARRGWLAPPGTPAYREEARQVLNDILAQEVVSLPDGQLLLTPGNWHETRPPYLANPSYFSPAAYPLFAQVQPDPRWGSLQQATYRLLTELSGGLGSQPGVGLFPDWCQVTEAGGVAPAPGRETRFGWEAVRLPFRVALDGLWFGEPRAPRLLKEKFLPFFKKEWQANGRLAAVYNYDGTPAVAYESPVLYAGVLAAALAAGERDFAGQLAPRIMTFYHEQDGLAYFDAPDNYYANNWAWLGLALYAGWVKDFPAQ